MSTQPRKERKALYNAPVHERRARIASHLDEPLLLKYGTRSATLRVGDTVRVMRGEYAGTTGRILEVNSRSGKVTVDGVTVTKADATQKPRAVDPSNLVITKLDLSDPKRRAKLGASEADATPAQPKPKKAKKAQTEEEEAPEAA
ncbi:MAG: large subunit ribosomal protein [Thermoplasmata archaeon]|jgi:large subunit ribosomal protein L24|nr:large subunit ribosomal protein [Thermoplasmata archaeon]